MPKYPNGFFNPKACRTCSAEFVPEAPSQLYCSVKCRGKNSYYMRNYGLRQSQVEVLKADQNQRCLLCESEGFLIGNNNHSEKLAVDHCHKTGRVRGMLCHNCNRALGLLKDDPALMRRAAEYVESFQ